MLRGVLAAAAALVLLPACAQARPRVLVAFLPPSEQRADAPEDAPAPPSVLDRLDRRSMLALGLVGASQGAYNRDQALLDMTQGTRVSRAAYSPKKVPELGFVLGPGRGATILDWRLAVQRSRSADAELEPGQLAGLVPGGAGYAGVWGFAQKDAILAAGPTGRIAEASIGSRGTIAARATVLLARHRLVVVGLPPPPAGTRMLDRLLAARADDELVVVMREPPDTHAPQLLPIGVAGLRGGAGSLTSITTRRRGIVAGIDVLPTILRHLGIAVPKSVKGRPIRARGHRDAHALARLESRLRVVGARRFPALDLVLLTWAALAASLAVSRGAPGRRAATRLGAIGLMWVPTVLLITAALTPARSTELILVATGSLTLGWLTDLAVRWPRAPMVPAAVGITAYAIDLAFGSPLIIRSLLGPNPRFGSRYYGFGNELEALFAALLFIGLAAAMTGKPRSRRAATTFALSGLVFGGIVGSGRLGADVGGVITIGAGTAVATLAMAPGRLTWRRMAIAAAVPAVAVLALAALDIVTGGNGHFTRTVLDAGSANELLDVVKRRYELAWAQLRRGLMPLATLAAVAGLVVGVVRYRRMFAVVADDDAWRAGLAGAAASAVAGALFNDSGPVLLVFGAFVLAMAALYLRSRSVPEPETAAATGLAPPEALPARW